MESQPQQQQQAAPAGAVPPAQAPRGKPAGGRGFRPRNNVMKDGRSDWQPQQRADGTGYEGQQPAANGGYQRSANGKIPAVHANGYGPHKQEPLALGEMASSELEKRKLALASEAAKLQAVRASKLLLRHIMLSYRCTSQVQGPCLGRAFE